MSELEPSSSAGHKVDDLRASTYSSSTTRWSRGALAAWGLVAVPPVVWLSAGYLDFSGARFAPSPAIYGDVAAYAAILSTLLIPAGVILGLLARRKIAGDVDGKLRGERLATLAAFVGSIFILCLVALVIMRGCNLD